MPGAGQRPLRRVRCWIGSQQPAGVVELGDTLALGAGGRKPLGARVAPLAPLLNGRPPGEAAPTIRAPGDWCIGNTAVSKTATRGSTPRSPAWLSTANCDRDAIAPSARTG